MELVTEIPRLQRVNNCNYGCDLAADITKYVAPSKHSRKYLKMFVFYTDNTLFDHKNMHIRSNHFSRFSSNFELKLYNSQDILKTYLLDITAI